MPLPAPRRPTTQSTAWTISPVRGLAGLAVREEEWRATLAAAATERLFLEPEWVLPWLEPRGEAARALFGVEPGEARAAAILIAEQLGPAGLGPCVLRPPGLGVGDYLDLLLPHDQRVARCAIAAMLDWLVASGGWDLLDLPNLPAEWPTADLVQAAAARRGLATVRRATYRRPFIALEGTWERFMAAKPAKLRYNLRARQRHLTRLGDVQYRHYTQPAEVAAQLPRAVELHARRWQGQRTGTVFSSSPTARRFYAEAARRMAGRGWIDLSTLELDGRMLAFALCFVYADKLYYYLPAFDPAYARFAPSTALLAHLIEHAYRGGLKELDFMLGDEAYKEQWANGSRATTRLLVAAPTARGRAALTGFRLYLAARERARRSASVQRLRRYGLRGIRP